MAVGISPRAYHHLLALTKTVAFFNGRDYALPADVKEIAVPALRHRVFRSVQAEAARMKDAGQRSDLEAGMAKLIASETGKECVEQSFRIHGGYGYSKEYEIERLYRDAPLLLIGEGTSEIQRMVIGKKLLERNKI